MARDVVARLLRSQVQGVLATVNAAGIPATHLMAFAVCPRLQHVFLATPAGTLKDRNMRAQPNVSLLWDDRTGNLADHADGTLATAAGTAASLRSCDATEARAAMLADNPNMAGFLAAESTVLFAVKVREWGVVEGYGSMRLWDPMVAET